jgi:hypothetical protein
MAPEVPTNPVERLDLSRRDVLELTQKRARVARDDVDPVATVDECLRDQQGDTRRTGPRRLVSDEEHSLRCRSVTALAAGEREVASHRWKLATARRSSCARIRAVTYPAAPDSSMALGFDAML